MNLPGPRPELRRVLSSWDAAALILGVIIGSGIFATPPDVARQVPGVAGALSVWVLGGVLALCGAFCYAELTGMFPHTGGAYVFLREGYGRFPAFAYGWSALLITYPASIAAVALVFTAYLARWAPGLESAGGPVAAALCLAVAGLNVLGVRLGAWGLRLLTGAKVAALLAVAGAGLWGGGSARPVGIPLADPGGGTGLLPLALALAAVLWTYEGWADGPTVAGEMRDPRRGVVRALILGTAAVTVVYLLVNLAYFRVLGVDGVQGSSSVAVDTVEALWGPRGGAAVNALVLVSTLGAMLGMVIGASRVFFAMARDGLFFAAVGAVHPRFGTPAAALVVVGLVSALYALTGTFEGIIRYFVFVANIWFVLNIVSVVRHRRAQPGRDRPFRVPAYPWPVLVYVVAALGLMGQLLVSDPRGAAGGLILVAAAYPAYRIWIRRFPPSAS